MTLSGLHDILTNTNGEGPAQSAGYGPETHHPLVFQEDGGGRQPGAYDNYIGMVRSMVDREMRTLGNYVQSGYYLSNRRLRSLVIRYYKLSQWQLTAPAGLMNHGRTRILRERASLLALLAATDNPLERAEAEAGVTGAELRKRYDTIFTFDPDSLKDPTYDGVSVMPLTIGDAYDRLDFITAEVRRLTALIDRAQRRRHYYDSGPIIEYFKTPYDERGEIDLMAIAPFFLQRLQVYVDVSIAEIWRHQGQRIIAQTADDDKLTAPSREDDRPKRRTPFGRAR